jgi:uncharacterized repeat protein (TIGR02543 family)
MAHRNLLTIIAVFFTLLALASGAGAAQVRVLPAIGSASVGSTVTLTVEADAVTDLGGFQFAFAYDQSKVSVESITVNSAFDQVIKQDPGTVGSGLVAATIFDNAALSGTNVNLATIVFKVNNPGNSTVVLSNLILGQTGGAEIPSSAVNGTIATSQSIGAIGLSPETLTVGGAATLSATASSGLSVTFSSLTAGICTVSGGTVSGLSSGTCTVAADQAGNSDYNSAQRVTRDILVGVNGVCGVSNGGTFRTAPATGLCAAGNSSALAGSGPWSWSCAGLNGGGAANCSAGIDVTGPSLTVSTIAPGSTTNNPTLNVSGTVADPSGVAGVTVNGAAVVVTNGGFSCALALINGSNLITIVTTDSLGNSTTDTRTVILDTAAPLLTVSTPADNAKTAQSTVVASGSINEGSTVTVSVNGAAPQGAALNGNSFSATVNLAVGMNTITLTATDLAGNATSAARTITYDNSAPSLAITNPSQDLATASNSLTVSGTVSDSLTAPTVTIDFNGQNFTPAIVAGAFSQQLTIPAEGSYRITATAVDEVGNSSQVIRNVILDASAPADGTGFTATAAGSYQINLSWSAATDGGSGLATAAYKLVRATGATAPADCGGTPIYLGSAASYSDTGLAAATQYAYRVCAVDNGGNVSTGLTATSTTGFDLSSAVGAPLLSFVTGGDAPWLPVTTTSVDGAASVRSGAIGDNQQSWLQTAVTGPGYVAFSWKVSSEVNYDLLRFYIDGVEQTGKISGEVNWTQVSYTFPAGSHTLRWAYSKDNSGVSGSDAGWVDQIVVGQDPSAPVDGILTATPGNSQIALSWSGFADPASGIASYRLVYGLNAIPANCASGTTLYSGPGTAFTHAGLTTETTYYYRVCATDLAWNTSAGATATLLLHSPTGFSAAVDAPALTFVTGGDAGWAPDTTTSVSGGASVRSGAIGGSQQSWFQSAVTGPGYVAFSWKVSSEENYDLLKFYIDGVEQSGKISGEINWQQVSYTFPAGSHTLRWAYSKDGSGVSGSDAGWVDQIVVGQDTAAPVDGALTATPGNAQVALNWSNFNDTTSGIASYKLVYGLSPIPAGCASGTTLYAGLGTAYTHASLSSGTAYYYRVCATDLAWNTSPGADATITLQAPAGLAAALGAPALAFTTGGNAFWFPDTGNSVSGGASVRSGIIGDDQQSWLETSVTGPGTVSFSWKVSSEANYDFLTFYLDGVEQSGKISGTAGWLQASYPFAAGSHTLRWAYSKDRNTTSGSDAGWLDSVVLTLTGTTYSVDFGISGHGSVTGASSQSVTSGGSTSAVTAVPADGYRFVNWTGSGDFATTAANPLVIANVMANTTVTANFAQEGACVAPPAGMVSWWKGEGSAADRAGLNGATLVNGASFAQGKVGQAFSFNGSGQYVVVADSPTLAGSNRFTLQAWINPAAVPEVDGSGIISKVGGNGGNNGYQLAISQGLVPGCQFNASGESWPTNSVKAGLAPLSTWTHVACTYDNDTLSMYVNGTLVGSSVIGPKSVAPSSSTLRISGDDNNHVYFDGQIDEVQIYNRALSANEIQSIYSAGGNGVCTGTNSSSDLSVSQTAGSQTVVPGQGVTFSLNVSNNGPDNSIATVVTDTLSGGINFVSASTSSGACSYAGNVLTCMLGELPRVLASSTFDGDTDGWTTTGDGSASSFVSSGGNPAGYVSSTDQAQGLDWYWRAPAKFLGNMAAAYQGTLQFDLKQSAVDSQYNLDDVVLVGGGYTLAYDTPNNPATTWTHYSIPLNETAGWKLNSITGPAASQAQILAVLGALTDLRIRGEFRNGADTGGLDNVLLLPGPATIQVTVNSSASTVISSAVSVSGASSDPDTTNNTTVASVIVDGTAPSAAIGYSASGPYKSGTAVTIIATFSEPMADTPAPSISLSGADTLALAGMTKIDVTHYSYSYVAGSGNGAVSIALAAGQNLAGTVVSATPTGGASFSLDNLPATGSIVINSGAASTAGGTASLTLVCTDSGSGCVGIQLSNDNFATSATFAYAATQSWTLTGGDGVKTVSVRFKDGAGNWSGAYSATINLITSHFANPLAGIGGSIAPNTPQAVANGATTTFTVTPDTGFTASVGGSCGGALAGATYTTNAITSDCTVSASFAPNSYAITFSSGGNGTLTGSVSQTVSYGGAAAAVTAVPAAGYHFVNWTGTAGFVTTVSNPLTVAAVGAAQTITANFAPDPVNGVCGASNGVTFRTAPTTGFCAAGNGSTVGGSGPWSWSCLGLYGGNKADCSAGIDLAGPVLTISTLDDGSITNNATLNVSGTAADPSGVAGVTVNGSAASLANGDFSHALTLQSGPNTVTIIATDALGNSTTDTRTVNLDTTAPVLAVSTPADNAKTAQVLAAISGSIDESSTVTVAVNGGTPQGAVIDGAAFTATVNLAVGQNTISLVATDLAGNRTTVVRTITYDNSAPSLAITSPGQDLTTASNSLTVSGTVSDSLTTPTLAIVFNGQVYAPVIVSGAFSQQLTIPAEGSYQITATATDEAGNSSRVTRNVIYAIPVNGACGSSAGGTTTSAPAGNFCLDGTAGIVSGSGPWSWSCSGIKGGSDALCSSNIQSYSLTFAAGPGGTVSGNASQIVNFGASATEISAVAAIGYHFVNWTGTAGFVTTASNPLTIATVAAAQNITANFAPDPVNGICGASNGGVFRTAPTTGFCAAGNGSAVSGSGPWSWSCLGVNGGGTVNCSAGTDVAGPTLTVSALVNGAVTNNATMNVSGTASDARGIAGVTINGSAVLVVNGGFSYSLTLFPGANTVTVVASDSLGNATTDTRTVTLDTGTPVVTITSPADNSVLASGAVTVTGTLDKTATVQATLNGGTAEPVPVTGNEFTISLNLNAGINTISISATDLAGNMATVKRTVISDTDKPALAVTDPSQDITVTLPTLILSGTAGDSSSTVAVTIAMDGLSYAPEVVNGVFQQQLNFTSAKQYTITVTATDRAGNGVSVQRNVIYDPVSTLTVTAFNVTKAAGSDNPPLTVAYSGFVNGDTAAVLNGDPAITTTAVTNSPLGNYPITVSRGTLSATNYIFNFVNGTLSVIDLASGADGRTTAFISATPGAGTKVKMAQGVLLSDALGNPVSGNLSMSSTSYGSIAALPVEAIIGHTTDGSSLVSLGAATDLAITGGGANVKTFSPSMRVTLSIPASFAAPGTTVSYYSFNGTNWIPEGSAHVQSDGSVEMQVGHLSIWAVARFKQLPTGKISADGSSQASISDALRALQISVGLVTPTEADLLNGDVAPLVDGRPSPNGVINLGDALVILRKAVGLVNW